MQAVDPRDENRGRRSEETGNRGVGNLFYTLDTLRLLLGTEVFLFCS